MNKLKLILACLIIIAAILVVVCGLIVMFVISPEMIAYILIGIISACGVGWALDYLLMRRKYND